MNPDLREFYCLAQEEADRTQTVKLCVYIAGTVAAMAWLVWICVRA